MEKERFKRVLTISLLFFFLLIGLSFAARLPTIGGDSNNWGAILNTFLNKSHNTSGDISLTSDANFNNFSLVNVKSAMGVLNAAAFSSIQDAINNLSAGGGEVFIPSGNYTINEPISINAKNRVTIKGAGKSTIIINNGTGNAIISQGSYSGLDNYHITIADMQVLGNPSSGDGILFNITYFSLIENVEVKNHGGDGIDMRSGFYNTLVHTYTHNNTQNGVNIDNTANANTFISPTSRQNRENGIRIATTNNGSDNSMGNSIYGCTIESNTQYGILISRAHSNRIDNCYFENNTGTQVMIDHFNSTSRYNIITGNTFSGVGLSINISKAYGTYITGNDINGGLNIGPDANFTYVLSNMRIEGSFTDNGTDSKVFHSPAIDMYYSKSGLNKTFNIHANTDETYFSTIGSGPIRFYTDSGGGALSARLAISSGAATAEIDIANSVLDMNDAPVKYARGISGSTTASENLRGVNVSVPGGAYNVSVAFARAEPTTYALFIQPRWNTTAWVTSRTSTAFNVNFSFPAPSGGSNIDWLLIG